MTGVDVCFFWSVTTHLSFRPVNVHHSSYPVIDCVSIHRKGSSPCARICGPPQITESSHPSTCKTAQERILPVERSPARTVSADHQVSHRLTIAPRMERCLISRMVQVPHYSFQTTKTVFACITQVTSQKTNCANCITSIRSQVEKRSHNAAASHSTSFLSLAARGVATGLLFSKPNRAAARSTHLLLACS